MANVLSTRYSSSADLIADIRAELGTSANVIAARWCDASAPVRTLDEYGDLVGLDNGAQVATYAHGPHKSAAYAFKPGETYYVASESWDADDHEWTWDVEGPYEVDGEDA